MLLKPLLKAAFNPVLIKDRLGSSSLNHVLKQTVNRERKNILGHFSKELEVGLL